MMPCLGPHLKVPRVAPDEVEADLSSRLLVLDPSQPVLAPGLECGEVPVAPLEQAWLDEKGAEELPALAARQGVDPSWVRGTLTPRASDGSRQRFAGWLSHLMAARGFGVEQSLKTS